MAEGLDAQHLDKDGYLQRSMKEMLMGDEVAWMFEAISQGMLKVRLVCGPLKHRALVETSKSCFDMLYNCAQVLPKNKLQELQLSDSELRVMTCGAFDDT